MKKVIFAVAGVVLVLAFVTAFADEMPVMTEGKDVGSSVNTEAPGYKTESVPAFRGGLLLTPEDVLPTVRAESGISGMAAGGVATEDENTRTWDNLMPRGETLE